MSVPRTHVELLAEGGDAAEHFGALASTGSRFFLDSATNGPYDRWSILGDEPFLVLAARGRRVQLIDARGTEWLDADPFDVLADILARHRIDARPVEGLPFCGGAVGYFGYELGRHIERLPATGLDDLSVPDMALAFYDRAVVFDHESQRAYRVRCAIPGVADRPRAPLVPELDPASLPDHEGFNRTPDEHRSAVSAVREYIFAGDIFQANIAQRFAARCPADAWELYGHLREHNPAPFGAFLDFGGFQVLSSSPERFLRSDGSEVVTRPIKGTIGRSADPVEDAELAAQLLASEKDRAELAMIVDLMRNDLGRVCEYGSIGVSEPMVLESYATVHHLVSTVVGRLEPESAVVDLLRATFPGGSITGAPKIRAMEIIDELEPHVRGPYTGSVGYIGFDGTLDLNVAIRTLTRRDDWVAFHVGGGIVADSDPESEYRETLTKGRGIFDALRAAGAMVPDH